jgi:hypothetical protein
MYEPSLTARKIATFDTAIFDQYREWESAWDWDPPNEPNRYLRSVPPGRRPDYTYMIYLPVNEARCRAFYKDMKKYPPEIYQMWENILKPACEFLASLTGQDDPVIVQADIARMKPLNGDTLLHTDTRYNQRYARRYNIAISTNNNCWLYHHGYDLNTGGVRDHIHEGEMWELNNKIPHAAVNQGDTWRTHLILDIMPRNYWDRMCELHDPYSMVPNPQGKNYTYDLDLDGKLIHEPLFTDLPHCFKARTSVI